MDTNFDVNHFSARCLMRYGPILLLGLWMLGWQGLFMMIPWENSSPTFTSNADGKMAVLHSDDDTLGRSYSHYGVIFFSLSANGGNDSNKK